MITIQTKEEADEAIDAVIEWMKQKDSKFEYEDETQQPPVGYVSKYRWQVFWR